MKEEKNKQVLGILCAENEDDYNRLYNLNKKLYNEISRKFKKFYIINLINLKALNSSKLNKKFNKFPKNFIIFKPNNKKELINFSKNKNLIAFNALGKSFSYFYIYYLLKKINVKQILLMNMGIFAGEPHLNKDKLIKQILFKINKKFSYYIFRILTILNIFPKIEIIFECSNLFVKSINNGFSRKVENIFPFTKLSYFRNVIKINSRQFDDVKVNKKKLTNKYIVFLDTNFDHKDRVLREGKIDKKLRDKYYLYLKNLFTELNKIYKKKIIFCAHPSSDINKIKNYLPKIKIIKNETIKYIIKANILIFHSTGVISEAIMFKKRIISLDTPLIGPFFSNRSLKIRNALKLHTILLNDKYKLNKSIIDHSLNKKIKNYNKYIKSNLNIDGQNIGYIKIINIIKSKFFN